MWETSTQRVGRETVPAGAVKPATQDNMSHNNQIPIRCFTVRVEETQSNYSGVKSGGLSWNPISQVILNEHNQTCLPKVPWGTHDCIM